MENKRTPEEIKNKIDDIASDESNFTDDSYGYDTDGNTLYERRVSNYVTTETLENFARWLYGDD